MQSSTPAADPTYVYPGMQSHCRPARMSKAGLRMVSKKGRAKMEKSLREDCKRYGMKSSEVDDLLFLGEELLRDFILAHRAKILGELPENMHVMANGVLDQVKDGAPLGPIMEMASKVVVEVIEGK